MRVLNQSPTQDACDHEDQDRGDHDAADPRQIVTHVREHCVMA